MHVLPYVALNSLDPSESQRLENHLLLKQLLENLNDRHLQTETCWNSASKKLIITELHNILNHKNLTLCLYLHFIYLLTEEIERAGDVHDTVC